VAGRTQAVYYRDTAGREPVCEFIVALAANRGSAAAKIHAYIDEYLNGLPGSAPPPEFPITSQVDGELRELRVRFAKTRYRVLYRRSGLLIVLLHIFEKNSAGIPPREIALANERLADFKARMDAMPRRRPRPAGHDAP
jgi:phage-related protein